MGTLTYTDGYGREITEVIIPAAPGTILHRPYFVSEDEAATETYAVVAWRVRSNESIAVVDGCVDLDRGHLIAHPGLVFSDEEGCARESVAEWLGSWARMQRHKKAMAELQAAASATPPTASA